MSLVLPILSILLRLAAVGWSLVLIRRERDGRLGFFTAMLVLMTVRQALTVVAHQSVGDVSTLLLLSEVPGLLVSLLALIAMFLLGRVLESNRRKEAERWLAEARYRNIVERQPDLICQFKPDGTLTFVNQTCADYFGRSREALAGISFFEFFPEKDRAAIRARLDAFVPDRSVAVIEQEVTTPGGQVRWHEWTNRAFFDDEGTLLEYQSIGRDVTDRKRVLLALRASEARFQELLDSLMDVVWSATADGREVIYVNHAFETIYGRPLGDLVEQPALWQEVIHLDDMERVEASSKELFEMGYTEVEYRIVRPDGEERWLLDRKRLVYDDAGRPVRMGGLATDVTDRKHAEQALHRVREQQLEQQRHEKERVEAELTRVSQRLIRQARLAAVGQIASSIAHDLRNPLATVRNATFYLLRNRERTQDKREEYLHIIDREVDTAEALIANLLEMSRAKEPVRHTIDLGVALAEGWSYVRASDNLILATRLDPDPFLIEADPVQLRQVLVNLFTNATQALEGSGQVMVRALMEDAMYVVEVRDDGPGIPEGLREEVFEPLFTTKARGTGLGLSICRQILEAHGGRMTYHYEPAAGAIFRMEWPREDVTAVAGEAP